MKVEQEYLALSSLASGHCLRRAPGMSLGTLPAKSALITTASAGCTPSRLRTPTARRPSKMISSAGVSSLKVTPRSARRAPHRRRHRAAAAHRVPHAEFVLQQRQDGEQAGAVERRHAEVLGLKREGEAHARVAEVPGEVVVHRLQRRQPAQRLEQGRVGEVAPPVEGAFQHRLEGRELAPSALKKGPQLLGVHRVELGDLAAPAGRGRRWR